MLTNVIFALLVCIGGILMLDCFFGVQMKLVYLGRCTCFLEYKKFCLDWSFEPGADAHVWNPNNKEIFVAYSSCSSASFPESSGQDFFCQAHHMCWAGHEDRHRFRREQKAIIVHRWWLCSQDLPEGREHIDVSCAKYHHDTLIE